LAAIGLGRLAVCARRRQQDSAHPALGHGIPNEPGGAGRLVRGNLIRSIKSLNSCAWVMAIGNRKLFRQA